MIKGGVYKERKGHKERDLNTSIQRQGKKQEEHLERERRVNSNNSYVNVVSSD